MAIRKINFYLASLGAAADQQGLFAQANQLTLMQQAFVEIAPLQLTGHCTLGCLSEGNLTLYASSGAIAAKLKQISPSVLLKFQKKGYEVTAIRVAVQAHHHTTDMDSGADKSPEVGPVGAESLSQLAAGLPESPLKTAVESLLKKHAGQRKNPDRAYE